MTLREQPLEVPAFRRTVSFFFLLVNSIMMRFKMVYMSSTYDIIQLIHVTWTSDLRNLDLLEIAKFYEVSKEQPSLEAKTSIFSVKRCFSGFRWDIFRKMLFMEISLQRFEPWENRSYHCFVIFFLNQVYTLREVNLSDLLLVEAVLTMLLALVIITSMLNSLSWGL